HRAAGLPGRDERHRSGAAQPLPAALVRKGEHAKMSADASRAPVTALPVDPDLKTVGCVTVDDPLIQARNVCVHYGDKRAIHDVSIDIARNQVLAMIGPSGCGKSTFLRCLNRMNDTIEGARVTGRIE